MVIFGGGRCQQGAMSYIRACTRIVCVPCWQVCRLLWSRSERLLERWRPTRWLLTEWTPYTSCRRAAVRLLRCRSNCSCGGYTPRSAARWCDPENQSINQSTLSEANQRRFVATSLCSCTNELCFYTVSRERPLCIFWITRSKFNRLQWFLVHNITKIFYVREFDPVHHTCNVTTVPREMQILFIWLE